MVTLGDHVHVWLGEHEGESGTLEQVTAARGCVLAVVQIAPGDSIIVPASYCDPNPTRLAKAS